MLMYSKLKSLQVINKVQILCSLPIILSFLRALSRRISSSPRWMQAMLDNGIFHNV